VLKEYQRPRAPRVEVHPKQRTARRQPKPRAGCSIHLFLLRTRREGLVRKHDHSADSQNQSTNEGRSSKACLPARELDRMKEIARDCETPGEVTIFISCSTHFLKLDLVRT